MAKVTFRDNFILEVYQPTEPGNVDPNRPPRGGSAAVLPSLAKVMAKRDHPGSGTAATNRRSHP
jgi:hypothetical protein